jgi:hypothetical protein
MKTGRWVVLGLLLAVSPLHADVWDMGSDNDDTSGTDNELVHGTSQIHDLAVRPSQVADEDWFRVTVPPFSSFEVVVDGTTGELNLTSNNIQRVAADGSTIVQDSVPATPGGFTSMRIAWQNTHSFEETSYIRISKPACNTSCTTDDQYQITARETTVYLARFNNIGTQITVLISQNASSALAAATYYFWNPAGVLITSIANVLTAKSVSVINTTGNPALAGQAGSITIAHTGPYGTWNAKVVALEPATGFTFDTPGVVRSY